MEEKVIELNECLSTPKCYEERGIVKVGEELQKIETELNRKIERYLELEEKVESFG